MDHLEINKESWNKRTETHIKSKFYDVDGFLNGRNTLNDIERSELGNVDRKSLLHLQCHFGLDTLSWARLGANVTGVDLSSTAVEKARELANQSGLEATFICSDVIEYGKSVSGQFDIVFTSYGVLCWMSDISKWAQTVAACLKPGGTFYIAEFHPFFDMYSGYSYFHNPKPDVEQEGTYTENDSGEEHTLITWAHPISDIINALISVGIRIDLFNEYPYSPYNSFDGMEERETGKFFLSEKGKDMPLVFTIRGTKL